MINSAVADFGFRILDSDFGFRISDFGLRLVGENETTPFLVQSNHECIQSERWEESKTARWVRALEGGSALGLGIHKAPGYRRVGPHVLVRVRWGGCINQHHDGEKSEGSGTRFSE